MNTEKNNKNREYKICMPDWPFMTATIFSISVKLGQIINKGDTFCILDGFDDQGEAKFPVKADIGGTVKKIKVKVGEDVGEGDLLGIIEY